MLWGHYPALHSLYMYLLYVMFDLHYISCTYVKPTCINCMVFGYKQYNTGDFLA